MRRSVSPFVQFVIGAVATLLLAMYSTFGSAPEQEMGYLSALGSAAIVGMCAAVIIGVAAGFGRKEPWRRQWMLVGLGVAAYSLAHLAIAAHAAFGADALLLPSPDVFFFAQYLLIGAAFVAVAQSYRPLVDARRPAAAAMVFGALAVAALWFGLVIPYVLPQSDGVAQALRTALYPAGDILFLFVPSAYVALSIAQLGGGRFARPWFLLSIGAVVLACGRAAAVWLQVTGGYEPGMVIDYVPLLAFLLMAAGALSAARLAEEFMAPARVPLSAPSAA